MKQITILFLILSFSAFSQEKNFYDFIVNYENDTLFGKYQLEKFIDLRGKKHKITNKKFKAIKKNDKIYNLLKISTKSFKSVENDSLIQLNEYENTSLFKKNNLIFAHNLDNKLRKDYLITLTKDTLFGEINTKYSLNKFVFGKKSEKINPDSIIYFRKNGFKYLYKQKRRINPSDKKNAFLKLLYEGEVNLYEYKTLVTIYGISSQVETHYYIERNGEIALLNPNRFYKIINRILPENDKLLKKIRKREFGYNDIYLVVKYFNMFTEI